MHLNPTETGLALAIRDALGSSLDIRESWNAAHPLLLRLIPANHAAVGLTSPAHPRQFDWIVADMPRAFFDNYGEVAQHDFVLQSLLKRPNRVLRDIDMVPRHMLESNPMYGLARDVGTPLEQVMSTLLHVDGDWQSGISLYRAERRPFSDRERELLQGVTPAFANAVRNWRRFGEVTRRSDDLDALLLLEGLAMLVFVHPGREMTRTLPAMALLDRWFGASRGTPAPLTEQVRKWFSRPRAESVPSARRWRRPHTSLLVEAYWLDTCRLAVVLREMASAPPELSRLTPREQQVVGKVLEGCDNAMIAAALGCSEATVKKHVYRVFNKLGVDRRPQLMARAQRGNWAAQLTRH
jgi:DNA-binding CsgD family transcriptional regulator